MENVSVEDLGTKRKAEAIEGGERAEGKGEEQNMDAERELEQDIATAKRHDSHDTNVQVSVQIGGQKREQESEQDGDQVAVSQPQFREELLEQKGRNENISFSSQLSHSSSSSSSSPIVGSNSSTQSTSTPTPNPTPSSSSSSSRRQNDQKLLAPIESYDDLEAQMQRDQMPYSYISGRPVEDDIIPPASPPSNDSSSSSMNKRRTGKLVDVLLNLAPNSQRNSADPVLSKETLHFTYAPLINVMQFSVQEQPDYAEHFKNVFNYGLPPPVGSDLPWPPCPVIDAEQEKITAANLPSNMKGQLENGLSSSILKQHIITPETIQRIAKKILPTSACLSIGALEIMQNCVVEFISLISSEAGLYSLNDQYNRTSMYTATQIRAQNQENVSGPTVVLGADVVSALDSLGFSQYARFGKAYMEKFQEQQALINLVAASKTNVGNAAIRKKEAK